MKDIDNQCPEVGEGPGQRCSIGARADCNEQHGRAEPSRPNIGLREPRSAAIRKGAGGAGRPCSATPVFGPSKAATGPSQG
eukprot:9366446-Pyramimonas_sp.AAC.1